MITGKKIMKLLSVNRELIQETLKDKPKKKAVEQNDFHGRMFMLNQQYTKRLNELKMWYSVERNRIAIQHRQRMDEIDIE